MVDSQFAEECLKHQNTFRALHNSPELVIDIKLNDFAQDWALTLAGKDILEHRQENAYGENLYVGYNSDPEWQLDPKVPVQSWYDEISAYAFDGSSAASPGNFAAVGHFTQLVWRSSARLGVGVAKSQTGRVYVVCNYEPAGNVDGLYADNVLPPAQKKDEGAEDTGSAAGQKFVATAGSGTTEPEGSASGTTSKTTPEPTSVSRTMTAKSTSITAKMTSDVATKLDTIIPAEDLRVWLDWLTKVAETAACEWHEWLLPRINLALRLNEQLLEARRIIEREKEPKRDDGDEDETEAGEETERSSSSGELEKFATPSREDKGPEIQQQQPSSDELQRVTELEEEVEEEEVEEQGRKEAEDVKRSIGTAALGVAESGVEVIPMPRDECEMLQFVRKFRRQARIYRVLYNQWIEIAERVIEEIAGKSEQVYTHEEIPRFCYLREMEAAADVDIGIESGGSDDDDDEEIVRKDADGRERITCNDLHLFFNLTDEASEIESSSYGNLEEESGEEQGEEQ